MTNNNTSPTASDVHDAIREGLRILLSYNIRERNRGPNNDRYDILMRLFKSSLPMPFGSHLKMAFVIFMLDFPGWDGSNRPEFANIRTDDMIQRWLMREYRRIINRTTESISPHRINDSEVARDRKSVV